MPATATWKVCTGANASTETASDYPSLMSTDAVDTGTTYQSNKISIPATGSNYSYERWLRFVFTGTFNLIDTIKFWKSAGTLSDANLTIKAGETDTGVTPVNTESTIATTAIPTTEGTAIDITPSNPIDSSGEKTDYLVMQLVVSSTVVTIGDIGSQTVTISYEES